MDVQIELEKVYDNRLLRTENEIREFEKAIENLISLKDASIIGDLCKGFDDATEHHEVMFGLVHGIEYLYQQNVDEGLYLIAFSVPSMIRHAKDWAEIMHYRILNHPQVRKSYAHVLSIIDEKTRKEIFEFLIEIKEEDPEEFEDSVNEVLGMKKS
ncbi:Imm30 family immunity protein [Saccharibacillus kuerlensis]|uniref:Immunity protein 30 domain-containing protein n=1 Tax=Saccharibacillus kuerlensis TaxID=459527 RepID=A0ABQ2L2B1_9BACL|nr:Imm30 family immunity protein [Saccharibacillus kuerlensis]GGO00232.1 hypothetical protein GCM10010969_21180 [Saccharibacillus kuerlensis]